MHTVKGWAMGGSAESQNVAHQSKKMDLQQLLAFRDRFNLPLTHEQVEKVEYLKFPEGSPEQKYLSTIVYAVLGVVLLMVFALLVNRIFRLDLRRELIEDQNIGLPLS